MHTEHADLEQSYSYFFGNLARILVSLMTMSWKDGLCLGRMFQHGNMISFCTALGVPSGGSIW